MKTIQTTLIQVSFQVCLHGDDLLMVGRDFVDAVAGERKSHGTITTENGKRFRWISSYGALLTEEGLRKAAAREGKRVVAFTSQNEAKECRLWNLAEVVR